MKNTIEIVTNEDGDVYGAVKRGKNITNLGALRAINKELRVWGIKDEVEIGIENLELCKFWETTGGEHDGWIWWSKPDKSKHKFDKVEYLGLGWIYKCY